MSHTDIESDQCVAFIHCLTPLFASQKFQGRIAATCTRQQRLRCQEALIFRNEIKNVYFRTESDRPVHLSVLLTRYDGVRVSSRPKRRIFKIKIGKMLPKLSKIPKQTVYGYALIYDYRRTAYV